MDNTTSLSINTEVLEKMAEIAAKEVAGVAGLPKKSIDLKGAIKTKNPFKAVKVENENGALNITIYICVQKDVKVREVAEKVQENVKDKIQTMTNNAVTKVNVNVADVEIPKEAEAE